MDIKLITATLSLALVAISNVQASITPITTRAGLGGNDYVDWGKLGGSYTAVASPSTILSANGMDITVSSSGGAMERRDQNNGWAGNFNPGDHLLWNARNDGDISITFDTGIYGAGAQVQSDRFNLFTGVLSAYGAANNLLGTYSFTGNSTWTADNTAIFAGITSDTAIYKITFTAFNGVEDFAINQLDFLTTAPKGMLNTPFPVPEPATYITGALIAIPFGFRGFRLLCKRK